MFIYLVTGDKEDDKLAQIVVIQTLYYIPLTKRNETIASFANTVSRKTTYVTSNTRSQSDTLVRCQGIRKP